MNDDDHEIKDDNGIQNKTKNDDNGNKFHRLSTYTYLVCWNHVEAKHQLLTSITISVSLFTTNNFKGGDDIYNNILHN